MRYEAPQLSGLYSASTLVLASGLNAKSTGTCVDSHHHSQSGSSTTTTGAYEIDE
jgi:hypothetical protein